MAAVVIIPGSFMPAELYDAQITSLAGRGVPSVAVSLPSVGRHQQAGTMADDVNEIIRVVEPILGQGKDVVLLAHSYGGIPATESLKQISAKTRLAQGKSGGVASIVYLASVIVSPGVCNNDIFGDKLADLVTVDGNYLDIDSAIIAAGTFNDLGPEEALHWAKRMSSHSTLSFMQPLTYPGYSDVRVCYILCQKDQIIPPEAQRSMIELLKSAATDVQAHEIDSGHAPNISRPDDISSIVKGFIDT